MTLQSIHPAETSNGSVIATTSRLPGAGLRRKGFLFPAAAALTVLGAAVVIWLVWFREPQGRTNPATAPVEVKTTQSRVVERETLETREPHDSKSRVVLADTPAERVIDRAIRAHGGESALAKAKTMIRSLSGTLNDAPFTSDLTTDLPDRYRHEVELGAQKSKLLFIVTRERGWVVNGGVTTDMSPGLHKENREEGYALYLTSLVPLRREKGIELASLPAVKVGGNPAVGVKVSQKGRDDVQLYFDKESGLLVRMTRQTPFAGLTAEKEYLFSDHKEVGGVKMPMKLQELMNGQKLMEGKVSSYRFLDRADDKAFAKP